MVEIEMVMLVLLLLLMVVVVMMMMLMMMIPEENIWKLLSMLEPQPGSMGFARDVPGQLEETLADFVAALLKPGQHI